MCGPWRSSSPGMPSTIAARSGERITDDTLLMILNADERPVAFTLPNHEAARRWEVVFDTVHADLHRGARRARRRRHVPRRRALGGVPASPAAGATCRRADPDDLVPPTYVDALAVAFGHGLTRGARRGAGGDRACRRGRRGGDRAVAARALPVPGELTLEDGTRPRARRGVPRDAPFGYHRRRWRRRVRAPHHAGRVAATCPRTCAPGGGPSSCPPLARDGRGASATSATCASSAVVSVRVGAGFLAVSPLGAPNPRPDPDPSPYFPSTRRWGNPIHLRIEEVPGAGPISASSRGCGTALERRSDRRPSSAFCASRCPGARASLGGRAFDRRTPSQRGVPARALPWSGGRPTAFSPPSMDPDWRRWPEPIRATRTDRPCGRPRAATRRRGVVPRLGAMVLRPPARAPPRRPIRRVADMPVGVRPRRVRCVGVAGPAGARRVDRRAARSIQRSPGRTGACRHSPRIGCARSGYRPFIETIRAPAAPRRRAAHRPRARPLPAVVDPGGAMPTRRCLRPPPDGRAARDRGARVAARRPRS